MVQILLSKIVRVSSWFITDLIHELFFQEKMLWKFQSSLRGLTKIFDLSSKVRNSIPQIEIQRQTTNEIYFVVRKKCQMTNEIFRRLQSCFPQKINSLSTFLCTVWPEPIWIKVNGWWEILPQHQSTYLRGQESASFEIPPFRSKFT